jgi:hypothetical protein
VSTVTLRQALSEDRMIFGIIQAVLYFLIAIQGFQLYALTALTNRAGIALWLADILCFVAALIPVGVEWFPRAAIANAWLFFFATVVAQWPEHEPQSVVESLLRDDALALGIVAMTHFSAFVARLRSYRTAGRSASTS